MILVNEKIKAKEVALTGLNGEDLGIVTTSEALALAKPQKADLVCTSLLSSPPPCKLVAKGTARQEAEKEKKERRTSDDPVKTKEFRLSVHIEEHDYDAKLNQMRKLLESGKAVQPVVRIQGKEGEAARKLLERLAAYLSAYGRKETGFQISGKQATVKFLPV
ncbi:translation initiation factor IF-3 [Paenibacillus thailandensis]|uniref:Translation initiation factor IF-3 n=1 Tax=Paenibacillus thailandensis TaxID=393250 RepID=A0ABW5QU17_9BACL